MEPWIIAGACVLVVLVAAGIGLVRVLALVSDSVLDDDDELEDETQLFHA